MSTVLSLASVGWDSHRKFSTTTLRNDSGTIVERRRMEHADRPAMRQVLALWVGRDPPYS